MRYVHCMYTCVVYKFGIQATDFDTKYKMRIQGLFDLHNIFILINLPNLLNIFNLSLVAWRCRIFP